MGVSPIGAAQHPRVLGTVPHSENYQAQIVSSARSEECSREIEKGWTRRKNRPWGSFKLGILGTEQLYYFEQMRVPRTKTF